METSLPAGGDGAESAAEAEANMVAATKLAAPAAPAVDVAALAAELAAAQSAYKGMQTKYNQLFTEKEAAAAEKAKLQELLIELERGMTTQTTQSSDLEKQIADLTAARDALQADVAKSNSKLGVYEMVDAEFPYLKGMAGKLPVGDNDEATRQILSGMNELVKGQVDQRLATVVGDYNSGGNMQRGAPAALTVKQLFEKAVAATGTKEYDAASKAYYTALEANPDNKIPRPPTDALDEFNSSLI